ncbi:MAG: hypothetical protein NZ941_00020 [Candidatus Caldarchaeum sp.]|nr:hypothetical protein [Candidatus Caldarchaeum sp.]
MSEEWECVGCCETPTVKCLCCDKLYCVDCLAEHEDRDEEVDSE